MRKSLEFPYTLMFMIISVISIRGVAQVNLPFVEYSTEDGLPDNLFIKAVQDKDGFLWFADNDNISRFDGYEFKVYSYNSDDSLMQLYREPHQVNVNNRGDLWIKYMGSTNSHRQLFKYDPGIDGFIRFKPQINVFVGVINQEESGVVWLSGNGNVNLSSNGLYEFIPDKQITNHYFHNDRDSLTQVNKNLISSIDDRDSCLYLLTNDGLWMFDKTNKTYRRPPVNPRDSSLLFYKHWNTTSVKFLRRNLACCRVSMELILHDDINDSKAAHKKL